MVGVTDLHTQALIRMIVANPVVLCVALVGGWAGWRHVWPLVVPPALVVAYWALLSFGDGPHWILLGSGLLWALAVDAAILAGSSVRKVRARRLS